MDPDVSIVERLSRRLDAGRGPARRHVCVAWSGGRDSTVLAHAALRLRRGRSVELSAVHVDHGLHESSRRHARHCRRLASDWGLTLRVTRLDLAPGRTGEREARIARYAALAQEASRLGAGELWTAHHADDALETALLQFLRGAGAGAIASLAPQRGSTLSGRSDLELHRPLAGCPRGRLAEYADERGLEWRRDPTNASDAHRRNRLRREVTPAIRREVDSHRPLINSLSNLAEAADLVEARVDALWRRARLDDRPERRTIFETGVLASAPDAALAGSLQRLARRTAGAGEWTRANLSDARDAIRRLGGETVGAAEPVSIVLEGAVLVVGPERTRLVPVRGRGTRALGRRRAEPVHIDLESPGSTEWFGRRLTWSLNGDSPEREGDGEPGDGAETLQLAATTTRLVVRGPRPGERIRPSGLDGETPVRDLLRGAGVPPTERWRWPCLARPPAEQGECLWVAGIRAASGPDRGDGSDVRRVRCRLDRLARGAADGRDRPGANR